ncbi:flagellar biosynthesis anti-sigma factor FlgM [Sphingomonas tabacisoli]|uniref:Flagellar biosynthesis anti-sigma factor FlgM n=1 Tax=Sphingomonas tabacisoli TaxID=2249466 RepID=A0ABW4HX47_9SPHN
MIDPIGVTPGTVPSGRVESDGKAKVVRIDAVRAAEPAVVAETSVRETAKALAFRPPVDLERVRQIKQALADKGYPIVPSTIADRMIEAQMRWVDNK